MRTLLVLFTSIISISAWAGALDDARTLGAPMQSVERAIQLSRGKEFSRKDVLAVFDIFATFGQPPFFSHRFEKRPNQRSLCRSWKIERQQLASDKVSWIPQ
jgi:hypothetical protein